MKILQAKPLTSAAFAPFGDVLEIPNTPGRRYFNEALANHRACASASLALAVKEPGPCLPLTVSTLERHEFSSQTFLPLEAGQYLVVVAPNAATGRPDLDRVQAFLANGNQGLTYRADTWHHGLTVFDSVARFAVLMWQAGDDQDEEFVDIDPITIDH